MGIWAGIKHALNSTLGTTAFKPLDKIYADGLTEAVNNVVEKCETKASVSAKRIDFYSSSQNMSTAVNVTGKGYVELQQEMGDGWTDDAGKITIIVDGNTIINACEMWGFGKWRHNNDATEKIVNISMRFNKSFVMKTNGYSSTYRVYVRGHVYFEE